MLSPTSLGAFSAPTRATPVAVTAPAGAPARAVQPVTAPTPPSGAAPDPQTRRGSLLDISV
jgi:hypothetical protein